MNRGSRFELVYQSWQEGLTAESRHEVAREDAAVLTVDPPESRQAHRSGEGGAGVEPELQQGVEGDRLTVPGAGTDL